MYDYEYEYNSLASQLLLSSGKVNHLVNVPFHGSCRNSKCHV